MNGPIRRIRHIRHTGRALDAAYKIASDRKLVATGKFARVAVLRKSYPELADRVVEGDLTLPGAKAEADERDALAKAERVDLYARLALKRLRKDQREAIAAAVED